MTQRLPLFLLILCLGGLGAALFLTLSGGETEERRGLSGPEDSGWKLEPEPAAIDEQRAPRGLTEEEEVEAASLATTVVLPLKLEFELVRAQGRLQAEGAKPLGSDATARLRGSAHTAEGTGIVGSLEFVAGPNQGRVLELDGSGRFGANDLYPGLALVEIRGRGVPGALREVLLREGSEAQLNVGFGRPAVVYGEVFDRRNHPLPGVEVVMDGQKTLTDEQGVFQFRNVASGKLPVFLSKPGYADLRSVEFITAGKTIALDELRYTLDEAATLRVSLPDRVGTGAPARVTLSRPFEAHYGGAERKYPWHRKNPTQLYAGETVQIEGLPAGRLRVQVFQPGAEVEPEAQETTLVAGETRSLSFAMKPAPVLRGRVLREGKPVQGALVRLRMPDATGASVVARGGGLGRAQVELDVLGHAAAVEQTVLTGADGAFELSALEDLSKVRYLTARGPDGRQWAGRAVRAGEREIDLQLNPVEEGTASLSVETSTRDQALPVEYFVDGEPHALLLPPGERLEIEDLPAGSWRYSARWGSEVIQAPTLIEIEGELDLFVPLPQGAIEGQSKPLRDSLKSRDGRGQRRG